MAQILHPRLYLTLPHGPHLRNAAGVSNRHRLSLGSRREHKERRDWKKNPDAMFASSFYAFLAVIHRFLRGLWNFKTGRAPYRVALGPSRQKLPFAALFPLRVSSVEFPVSPHYSNIPPFHNTLGIDYKK
jgi:hypothetical protein